MLVGKACAQFILRAFGFGPAKSRAVSVGLLCRLLALAAFLESFQVDYIPHAFPPSSRKGSTNDLGKSAVALGTKMIDLHREKSQ
jgi:hypothetical protein